MWAILFCLHELWGPECRCSYSHSIGLIHEPSPQPWYLFLIGIYGNMFSYDIFMQTWFWLILLPLASSTPISWPPVSVPPLSYQFLFSSQLSSNPLSPHVPDHIHRVLVKVLFRHRTGRMDRSVFRRDLLEWPAGSDYLLMGRSRIL